MTATRHDRTMISLGDCRAVGEHGRSMRGSIIRIVAFLALWAALTAGATMSVVARGGRDFFRETPYRVALELLLTLAVLIALIVMVRFVDRRPLSTIGFTAGRLFDLLTGTMLGAATFALPLAVLVGIGAARFEPNLGGLTAQALGVGVFVCFLNVVTQEVLVRSYMFQELWAKYGARIATLVTTAIFLLLHAGPIAQGPQGLVAGANILLASLMLSLAYVRTGSLWLPIGLHLGWNGLQGPVLNIQVTGHALAFGDWSVFSLLPGNALWTGGALGIEGGLVGLMGPAAGLAIVAFAFEQQPKPDFSSLPAQARASTPES